jgi:hypothetical protein
MWKGIATIPLLGFQNFQHCESKISKFQAINFSKNQQFEE